MRRLFLIVVILAALGVAAFNWPFPVERPAKDGTGPLAVTLNPSLPAPEYHTPLDWWQTHHWEILNRGDLQRADCLYCHDPLTSCNNCHDYAGAAQITR